jgi:hypothetical protein
MVSTGAPESSSCPPGSSDTLAPFSEPDELGHLLRRALNRAVAFEHHVTSALLVGQRKMPWFLAISELRARCRCVKVFLACTRPQGIAPPINMLDHAAGLINRHGWHLLVFIRSLAEIRCLVNAAGRGRAQVRLKSQPRDPLRVQFRYIRSVKPGYVANASNRASDPAVAFTGIKTAACPGTSSNRQCTGRASCHQGSRLSAVGATTPPVSGPKADLSFINLHCTRSIAHQ